MRKLLLLIVTLTFASTAAAEQGDWREKAVTEIRKEKKVVEAMFSQPISLWVSLVDDGTRRDGFASYLCMTLHDAGMPQGDMVIIKIWDAAALARNDMVEIGRYDCERN